MPDHAAAGQALLSRLPPATLRSLMAGRREGGTPAPVAAAFLEQLEPTDRSILVLALGLGLDLGSVAFALQLDPSIVAWRLRRTLLAAPEGVDPAALELGVAQWLRSPAPGASAGGDRGATAPISGTIAARHFAALPEAVRERLAVRLDSGNGEAMTASRRPGLGIGSLVLILVAAAGFMVYGAIRDVNPLWRGMAQVRAGEYAAARDSFQELGSLAEGRAWVAITFLAEGDYDQARDILADPDTAKFLGEFRPMDAALQPVEADPASHALLPRGLIADARPRFVYIADGATTLTLELQADSAGNFRKVHLPLPDAGTATGVSVLDYPADWPDLTDGVVLWDVQEDDAEPTACSVLARTVRRDLAQHAAARLTHEIPLAAREFLRANFDLRNGLLVEAATRFATLTKEFPAAAYPKQMLGRIGAALGVDPKVLVR